VTDKQTDRQKKEQKHRVGGQRAHGIIYRTSMASRGGAVRNQRETHLFIHRQQAAQVLGFDLLVEG